MNKKMVARCTDATFNADELILKFQVLDRETSYLELKLNRQKAEVLKMILKNKYIWNTTLKSTAFNMLQ